MAQTIGSLDLNAFSDLYSDSTQYFWFESNASATYGAGAHVTLVPDTSFISNPTGQNILMNTDGFSIRNGLLPMMTLDNNSLDFNVVNTTAGTYVPTATFSATSAQIGQSSGTHLELNIGGLSILNGALPIMTLDNDSLNFNVVDTTAGTSVATATFGSTGATIGQTNGAHIQISSSGLDVNTDSSTSIASFGINGAQIGQSGAAHSVIDANGQRFYASDGSTLLANIGYGIAQGESGTLNAPFYTFGRRLYTTSVYDSTRTYQIGNLCLHNDGDEERLYVCITDIDTPEEWNGEHWQYYIGNSSVAEGGSSIINVGNVASGSSSHAEGRETKAIGYLSHTEGRETKATGESSHAEGNTTTASGRAAHAEGWGTRASGDYSHSQNFGTRAVKKAQTAIGSYNEEDTSTTTTHQSGTVDYGTYAFIIGNGVGSTTRSNALTVDWNGGIQMYLDSNGTSSSAATSGDDMDLFNAIYNLGLYSSVIV